MPGAEGDRITFHRPARAWPTQPSGGPIALPSPPSNPLEKAKSSRWQRLLPMMGSLAMVGFVFIARSIVYVIVIGAMVISMVLATLVTQMISGREQRREWANTRRRYLEGVAKAGEEASRSAAIQRAGLEGLYPDERTLANLVSAGEGIWERRRGDRDFGWVRLGIGDVPAAREVSIADSAGLASEPDAELAAAADEVKQESGVLHGAPVVVPLTTLGVVAVVGGAEESRGLIGSWLLGLAASCGPGDLRFIGLADYRSGLAWDWVKWLPHCRDPQGGEGFSRSRRSFTMIPQLFAADVADLVRQRLETASRMEESAGEGAVAAELDHAVVVVDGWYPGMLRELDALMPVARLVGVTVVVRVETPDLVPEHCGATVQFDGPGRVRYLEAGPGGRVDVGVTPDKVDIKIAEDIARRLAPLRLRDQGAGVSYGDSVRLTDLLGAEDPLAAVAATRPLDLIAAQRSPDRLLTTPIGRDDTGSPIVMNLREAAAGGMGPHGILVGATGSGKSELLKSLTAGLAVNHDPDLLNLLLVDFKGGAAFAGLERLPHVAGLVTNLADEPDLIARVRAALSGELERRQRVLRDAGNLGSIREYHRIGGTDLPYLVVVVDEFGELLVAEPEFVETFNAIGRLGRSLGIHLLLATQRLDEGRIHTLEPHLRYRMALRTYTSTESRSVLGSAAAYELPPVPGLGYLKVDDRTVRFKAAITTLPHRREHDAPDTGEPFRLLTLAGRDDEPDGAPIEHDDGAEVRTQLDVLVDAVANRATSSARPVWLAPLPSEITLGQLNPTGSALRRDGVAVGLIDRPGSQTQVPLRWNPWERDGNLGVVGGPRSGKSTFLTSLILGTVAADPSVQIYCLDLGGGTLHPLRDLPQVGAILGPGEPEVAARLLRDVRSVIAEREASRRTDPSARPATLLVVVDNIGLLRQSAPELETELSAIATTGLQHQVHVVVSAHRWFDIRPQLLDALTVKTEFRLGDPLESITNRTAAKALPADRPGRGLTSEGELFQAALPEWDAVPDPLGPHHGVVDAVAAEATRSGAARAPRIASLPTLVRSADAARLATEAGSTPPRPELWLVGVSEFRNQPVQLDPLTPGAHLAVYGDGQSGKTTVLGRLIRYLQAPGFAGKVNVHLVDPSRTLIEQADSATSYVVSAGAAEKLATRLALDLQTRVPPEEATLAELRAARSWEGPQELLVVDDYETLITSMGSPLTPLAELVPRSTDIGLHLVVARRVAGLARNAFEPFTQRFRDLRPPTLILSGTPDEGPLTAGVTARPLPPGRGVLVTSARPPQLVQCCLPDEETP